MKSKIAVVFSLCASLGFATGDFAPVQINNEWVYSYVAKAYRCGVWYRCDSMVVTIKITGIKSREHDTLVFLQVIESGTYKQTAEGPIIDSVISQAFIDTAVVRGDSINLNTGHRSPICPFWECHDINSDSLKQGTVGGNTVLYKYCKYTGFKYYKRYYYIQNVGLFNYSIGSGYAVYGSDASIDLISFNNNNIKLPIKNTVALTHYAAKIHTFRPNLIIGGNGIRTKHVYDLMGRGIVGTAQLPSGIYYDRLSGPGRP